MANKKRRIATIDCETDPFQHGEEVFPFCWGFFDGDNYYDFWGDNCTEQLIECLKEEEGIIVYAHNGGKFDFHYLLPYLDESIMMINGRIAKATLFDGKIEIRDSYLILPMALSQFQKDEIDYNNFKKSKREKYKKEILKYLRGDCIYLHEWTSKFIDQFGGGLTLAGAAFKQLKKTGYEITRSFDDYDSKFRPFYYGGRVQCFEVGAFNEELKFFDINSAYPETMQDEHWFGNQYIEHVRLPEGESGSWFAEIEAISRGALPYRPEGELKLYFPDDNNVRRYLATGHEINAGLETGTLQIKNVIKSYRPLFTQSFIEYVKKFYQMKNDAAAALEKNPNDTYAKALYTFAKLMLNSAYGKFGQDGRKFEKFSICDFGEWPEGDGWTPFADTPTGQMVFSRPDPQDSFFNVATAASITGAVRAKLWRTICSAERPLYCDTDSIICKNVDVPLGDKLGEWKIEMEPTEVYIAQRKMYAMKDANGKEKVASKGVRLTFEQIKTGVLTGENITFYKDAPSFSLKYGQRFSHRVIDFKNIYKNVLTSVGE